MNRDLGFRFPQFALAVLQIAEAVHGQAGRIMRALLRHGPDMPGHVTLRAPVQVVPGHGTVDIDRASDWFGDVGCGHTV